MPSFAMVDSIKKGRKSIFREVGLDNEHQDQDSDQDSARGSERATSDMRSATSRRNTITSEKDIHEDSEPSTSSQREAEMESPQSEGKIRRWYSRLSPGGRPRIKTANAPPPTVSSLSRLTMIALLIAVVLPGFGYNNGRRLVDVAGANAGVVRTRYHSLDTRADSPTQVCKRWAHHTALLNGTMYIYGGQTNTEPGQRNNTWNNNFLTLDLTKSWPISSPALTGLPQPSGPPAVSLGYLWNDYSNLYVYGGAFADNPYVTPEPFALWQYNIGSKTWKSYDKPQTSPGQYTDQEPAPVQRAAEGAGLSVPELGLSWYFGGHLDLATTPGWSNQIARVYLKSLLEFTHPGFNNPKVNTLISTSAGEGGAFRNITQGGLQASEGFTERADGILIYVPGWGESGVLLGMGGGTVSGDTNDTFSESFSTLDVYDIKNGVWYNQKTTGTPPGVRVNQCAVIANAPDASSFNIYIYGGQNLVPYKEQVQYSDMYILSIPSFTWVKVPDGAENAPAARAGHTCKMRDGQMIVLGGFTGVGAPCESPGVWVFNAGTLKWQDGFNQLSEKPDLNADNSVLAGSFGYKVPEIVYKVIGGDGEGHATATVPAAGATGGPFATGKPPVYTVTAGAAAPTATEYIPGGGSGSNSRMSGGLIAAAVIAGVAVIAALYLGYCAWLYRRQVRAYKQHLAVANRYSGAAAGSRTNFGGLAYFFGRKGSKESKKGREAARPPLTEKTPYEGAAGVAGVYGAHGPDLSSSTADSRLRPGSNEPKPSWLSDEPTPASGTGTGSSGQNNRTPEEMYRLSLDFARTRRKGSDSGNSEGSAEGLLSGQEPSFFNVVLGPRRALRVVNGMEGQEHEQD